MVLSIAEMLQVGSLVPQKGNADTQAIVVGLVPKLKLLPGDKTAINYVADDDGRAKWNGDKAENTVREIDLTDAEIGMLKRRIKELESTNDLPTLPLAFCTLCGKLRDYGPETLITKRK
jgi:hypothetical protein